MAVYWLTFRIENKTISGKSPDKRREDLYSAIQAKTSMWWLESTSFIVFESTSSISALATSCKAVIAPSVDLFLIRAAESKSARICGNVTDKEIFTLMPYLETV